MGLPDHTKPTVRALRRSPHKFECEITLDSWPLKVPFTIAGRTFESSNTVTVTLRHGALEGRGEASGVFFLGDTPDSIANAIRDYVDSRPDGFCHADLQATLPPGGARNALDCALWDIDAKISGQAPWEKMLRSAPAPVCTMVTCSAGEPEDMASFASQIAAVERIKLKLTGEPCDGARIKAVRAARPDAWLSVDANQAWDGCAFEAILPVLIEADIRLVEQPFPVGRDFWLDDIACPIPIAADESALSLRDLPSLVGRYHVVNIKLDKCGGLTEGVAMAGAARALGIAPMVGNMMGTSLAMAPAYLLAQLCDYVDLDGPIFLAADRRESVRYDDGRLHCPPSLWGDRA